MLVEPLPIIIIVGMIGMLIGIGIYNNHKDKKFDEDMKNNV